MATEQKSDEVPWPSEVKSYQWKGTISLNQKKNTWNVLAHCKDRKQDVFIKIKDSENMNSDDIATFTQHTKQLIAINHDHLITPDHAFVHKSQIWIIYPRHSGGPLDEVLKSHYPSGIHDEGLISAILYDCALGLHYLHSHQQVHRNISALSVYIDLDIGFTSLAQLGTLKTIKWKKSKKDVTFANSKLTQSAFVDPLILCKDDRATWYLSDIYAFGITALQLVYGHVPPMSGKDIYKNNNPNSICVDIYDTKCPFQSSFENLIKQCCTMDLAKRIGINDLLKHKFFTKKCTHSKVRQRLNNILRPTEARINQSLSAPPTMRVRNGSHSKLNSLELQNLPSMANVTAMSNGMSKSNSLHSNASTSTKKIVMISADGNATHDRVGSGFMKRSNSGGEGQKMQTAQTNTNKTKSMENETDGGGGGDDEWQFSTTMSRNTVDGMKQRAEDEQSQREKSSQNIMQKTTSHDGDGATVDGGGGGDGYSNENAEQSKEAKIVISPSSEVSSDPSANHDRKLAPSRHQQVNDEIKENDVIATHSTRQYHISFSNSVSESVSGNGDDCIDGQGTTNDDGPVTPLVSNNDNIMNINANNDNDNATKTGRFILSTARLSESGTLATQTVSENYGDGGGHDIVSPPNASDDEDDVGFSDEIEVINENKVLETQNDENVQTKKGRFVVAPANVGDGASADDGEDDNNGNKDAWTSQQCSDWVGSLGDKYKQYMGDFIENGIDGAFMNELDDEVLKDIVSSALHRKKIMFAWNKL